ncbi:helix-turn-helix transcriptional regulator [Pseudomonas sp. O11]|uniref:helix-turn-helix transcriptional regulator n=1 Tax=Pseudomonas sp. O11 TaxID=3159446 RepID=UPI00387A9A0A
MATQKTQSQATALLRLPAVLQLVGLSKTQVYRLARAGEFPAPVRLGANSVAWPATHIQAWIDDKVSGSADE